MATGPGRSFPAAAARRPAAAAPAAGRAAASQSSGAFGKARPAASVARPRFPWPLAVGLMALAAGVGGVWAATALPNMPALESPRTIASREAAERRAEHRAFTAPYLGQESQEIRVAQGETLANILTRAGATPGDANAALTSVSNVFNPRSIRPGQPISLYFQRRSPERVELTGFAFRSAPGASVTVNRVASGDFTARTVLMPLTFEIARVAARVDTSLYDAAQRQGATSEIIAQMADVFSYDVDFQRDIHPGDPFEFVFHRFYDDKGETVRTGELLYVSLSTNDRKREYYRFQAPGDRSPQWYDLDGNSARKALMKTPINGARISSGFGFRMHPIMGYSRMHRGVDFAAPSGTPIMAAGEGVVDRAGRFGGYGNYVRIRHASNYETAYAHMSRFARGIRPGARVRQGQIIGYVGTTGASTGPHLHYEVYRGAQQINPMGLRVQVGRNLTGADLQLFLAERARIDRLREVRQQETEAQIARATQVSEGGASRGLAE
ncbi:MAG: M23 family metallopeptidase [Hyphomonadaceae bacterium]|nr:M23 family metallopeptidase [Hyphomonadaceae bacterium]